MALALTFFLLPKPPSSRTQTTKVPSLTTECPNNKTSRDG